MNNEKNMGPVRSSDEARERGRNGGIASGKSRRRKKEVRERLKEALNCAVVNPKVKSMMKQGITPACAGKTGAALHGRRHGADHPRVCGENRRQGQTTGRRIGSPPRVRGKQGKHPVQPLEARITPACAGKTCRCSILFRHPADHPRVCGENFRGLQSAVCPHGSPPRVRGKHNL